MNWAVSSVGEEQLWTWGSEINAGERHNVEGSSVVQNQSEESIAGVLKVSMLICVGSDSWLGSLFCLNKGSCCHDLVHFYCCENGFERLSFV